ncbi:MAG: hypothetical protein ACMUJM_01830 [bacterium]
MNIKKLLTKFISRSASHYLVSIDNAQDYYRELEKLNFQKANPFKRLGTTFQENSDKSSSTLMDDPLSE